MVTEGMSVIWSMSTDALFDSALVAAKLSLIPLETGRRPDHPRVKDVMICLMRTEGAIGAWCA